jgi:hypothetical protein
VVTFLVNLEKGWVIEQGYGADDVPLTKCMVEGCTTATTGKYPDDEWWCSDHPPCPWDGKSYTAQPGCAKRFWHHLGEWCSCCQGYA